MQSILFAACIKQKKEVFTKNQCPLSLINFFSFHWKQSKKHSYFWEEWVGDITFLIFLFKTIFASSLPPPTPSEPPIITDHGELWQEWVMLGNGEVGFVGAEAQGEGKGSGVVVVVVSVVLGGPRGGRPRDLTRGGSHAVTSSRNSLFLRTS